MSDPPAALARLPEQYFMRLLAAVAAARAAPGERLIDLGRGNPDIPPPPHVREAVAAAALEESVPVHGYPPFAGHPSLREAIARRYAADHGVTLDPEREVTVVPGTKTGIMLVALACADAGDVVLLPDPGYPDYPSGVALAGARAVALPLDPSAAFQPRFDAVRGERAALTVLNYPSNPCATCVRSGTFDAAVAFAAERGGWLLHDLAYDRLAFDGHEAGSVLSAEGARDVAVELWSPSKVYGIAGWRIGFLVGCAEIVGRVQTLIDHMTAGVWTGLQRGLEVALTGDQSSVDERREVYRRRRDVLVAALPGLAAPEGTFYAWWRLPEGVSAERLLDEHRVAVAPGEGFGSQGRGWARLSLAIPDEDVREAAERLARVV
ncbi:MAG TPA: aminotransferase class I/II-fold pyridoxal phosphate-dependent enzyme [Solirubrobacteraceae bacterium]|nr:aminotransferase class I/II-fold pyridoxal phosphate-dependent enzyme [Solirubrobacteraceae bacterium]